jgi:autotransporter passenger strand-loop-strand repeat protein
VSVGGTATDNKIDNSGAIFVVEGGNAISTLLSGNSATLGVSSGGKADFTTLREGYAFVYTNGFASRTTISGGSMTVNGINASAYSTIISGGEQRVLEQGVTTNDIITGGSQVISSGGSALGAIVSGGQQIVLSVGLASGTTVLSGGSQVVGSSAFVSATTISSGGTLTMMNYASGSAVGIIQKSGGIISAYVTPHKKSYITGTNALGEDFSIFYVPATATASATNFIIYSGGFLGVDFGEATNTTIYEGGKQEVTNVGIVSNTTISGGYQKLTF